MSVLKETDLRLLKMDFAYLIFLTEVKYAMHGGMLLLMLLCTQCKLDTRWGKRMISIKYNFNYYLNTHTDHHKLK